MTTTTRNFADFANIAPTDAENLGPATETVIDDCPAYTVVRRTGSFAKPVRITSTDRLGKFKAYKTGYWEEFSPGSVASYALSGGNCPIEAIDRARANGHKLHWINGCGASITAHARAKKTLVAVEVGMVVLFEGRTFEIVAERNDNLGLKEVVA